MSILVTMSLMTYICDVQACNDTKTNHSFSFFFLFFSLSFASSTEVYYSHHLLCQWKDTALAGVWSVQSTIRFFLGRANLNNPRGAWNRREPPKRKSSRRRKGERTVPLLVTQSGRPRCPLHSGRELLTNSPVPAPELSWRLPREALEFDVHNN